MGHIFLKGYVLYVNILLMKDSAVKKQNSDSTKYFLTTMGKTLFAKTKESFFSVLPVALIVIILYFTPACNLSVTEIVTFSVCAVFLILGIALFNLGADMAMTPMGQHIGSGLVKSKNFPLLLIIAFVMGVLITIAEPDLSVLADQVSAIMNNVLLIAVVGIGVGLFLLIGMIKVIFKKDLTVLLLLAYMILFALCALLIESGNSKLLSMAFDSGGVTTGPITVPFIMALGVGVASTIGGRDSQQNSFGLIALCSIGPMIAVALLSIFSKGELAYELSDYAVESKLGGNFGLVLGNTCHDVIKALILIIIFFLILQVTVLKLPKKRLVQIIVGIIFTFIGLVVFLTAVEVGFMPIGFKLGTDIAAFSKPLLAVLGFIIGFVVVLAEPAVHVLNQQVEDVTEGSVSKKSMFLALTIGVGISICLSMIRIIFNFSLLYYLIPGYIITFVLSLFVPKMYTAIAFDSGGVASGPLTSSFILPFAIGACDVLWGTDEVLSLGFGIVAMVAMTPLITIQILGFRAIATNKVQDSITMKRIVDADDEQIIDFM